MKQIIKLELSGNRKKILIINDLIPAVVLLITGVNSLKAGAFNTLALINILSGGLVVIFGLRELHSSKKHEHQKIQWYDLISGIVLMLNAATMYKPEGFQPAYLYFAASVLIILKALSIIGPMSLFHRVTISDAGFTIKTSPFAWYHFSWNEIEDISIRDHILNVTTSKGQRRIPLTKIADIEEMNSALIMSLQKNRSKTITNSSSQPT